MMSIRTTHIYEGQLVSQCMTQLLHTLIYHILSATLSTMYLHCSSVIYSLFCMALVMAMTCTTLPELTHTRPFIPTVSSNLKYLPSASTTAHEGDKSLRKEKVIILSQHIYMYLSSGLLVLLAKLLAPLYQAGKESCLAFSGLHARDRFHLLSKLASQSVWHYSYSAIIYFIIESIRGWPRHSHNNYKSQSR